MTRDSVKEEVLNINAHNILCELPTGFGKSRIAIEFFDTKIKPKTQNPKILIVIPRLVLINNWKEEFIKWGYEELLKNVEFVTYVSFPKNTGIYNMVIFDEAHHLSERCREALSNYIFDYKILLSATVGRKIKKEIQYCFYPLYIYKVSTRKAIEEEIIPDPTVYLWPIELDNWKINHQIIKNKKAPGFIEIPWQDRFKYLNVRNIKIGIRCTQKQYYEDLSSLIEWYKRKASNPIFKNRYLKTAGERLKWLSNEKTIIVNEILKKFKDYRTLTFCNSINQTEELGKYCINSKNKASTANLQKFNSGKIKHITACNMLDEGINLSSCRIGIYAVLNSSERMIKQKLGRLLRHNKPVIIIPYYRNTREEEIVNKMIEDYNPQLIKRITNLNEIEL